MTRGGEGERSDPKARRRRNEKCTVPWEPQQVETGDRGPRHCWVAEYPVVPALSPPDPSCCFLLSCQFKTLRDNLVFFRDNGGILAYTKGFGSNKLSIL
jgi:hypothetical protein